MFLMWDMHSAPAEHYSISLYRCVPRYLSNVVYHKEQLPLYVDLRSAPQGESIHSQSMPYIGKHRLNGAILLLFRADIHTSNVLVSHTPEEIQQPSPPTGQIHDICSLILLQPLSHIEKVGAPPSPCCSLFKDFSCILEICVISFVYPAAVIFIHIGYKNSQKGS